MKIGTPREITAREERVCVNHGRIFASAATRFGFDMEDFADKYMRSDFCERCMDTDWSVYQLWWPEEALCELEDEFGIEKADKQLECIDTIQWIGYMYRLLWFRYGLKGKDIAAQLPFSKMMEYFYPLHTMSYEQASDWIVENLELSEEEKQ